MAVLADDLALPPGRRFSLWSAVRRNPTIALGAVLLSLLGGGVFGNATEWIYIAIERALKKAQGHGLDVRLVSYGPPSAQMRALANIELARR